MTLFALSRHPDGLSPDARDLRGWEARTLTDDERVGTVDDLYLDGDGVPRWALVESGPRHRVPVPLDHLDLDSDHGVARVRGRSRQRWDTLPAWEEAPAELDGEEEERLRTEWAAPAQGGRAHARSRELVRLSELEDHRVAKGSADPRGWAVLSSDGHRLGEVAELLVDPASMRARFLDVKIDEKELRIEPVDRHVLLPVARVRLADKKVVEVDRLGPADVEAYPVYSGLPLSQEQHDRIARWFDEGQRAREGGAADRPPAPEERPTAREAATTTIAEDEEVRVRVRGGEIIVEKGAPRHG